jgi:cytochrome c5
LKRILIAVSLVLGIVTSIYAVPPGTDEEITNRLEPFGTVCRSGEECGITAAAVATGPLSGEQVYNQFCFACHSTGVGGAPKLGNPEEWQPRLDKGMDQLMATTLTGLNAMPIKGTCMNCSDEELGEAIDFMLEGVR